MNKDSQLVRELRIGEVGGITNQIFFLLKEAISQVSLPEDSRATGLSSYLPSYLLMFRAS